MDDQMMLMKITKKDIDALIQKLDLFLKERNEKKR